MWSTAEPPVSRVIEPPNDKRQWSSFAVLKGASGAEKACKLDAPPHDSMRLQSFSHGYTDACDTSTTGMTVMLKKTRRGQVRRIVRETYFQDEIPCGIAGCELCLTLDNPGQLAFDKDDDCIYIVDAAVAFDQIDFLAYDPCVNNCVLPTSVLAQVSEKNRHFYVRLRNLSSTSGPDAEDSVMHTGSQSQKPPCAEHNGSIMEHSVAEHLKRFYVFPNHVARETKTDRKFEETLASFEERRTWVVVRWYRRHIAVWKFSGDEAAASACVVLLTNSKKAKERAQASGIAAFTVAEFAESMRRKIPLAGEFLADAPGEISDEEGTSTSTALALSASRESKRPRLKGKSETSSRYTPHLSLEQIRAELQAGRLLQGIIRMERHSSVCGTVTTSRVPSIRILGYRNVNRAVDGDLVAVQILRDDVMEKEQVLRLDADQEEEILEPCDTEEQEGIPLDTVEESKKDITQSTAHTIVADVETGQVRCGKVVGIIRRNWKEYSGSLLPLKRDQRDAASTFIKVDRIFRPWDPRIPDILIKTRQSVHLDGKRVVVALDAWDRNNRYPSGHWTQVLGDIDDPEVESSVILKEHDVITRGHPTSFDFVLLLLWQLSEFSDAVLKCLPPATYTIPQDEIQRRLDYRQELTCSIDPPGCKDIDDALSCKLLPNGNYEVGVHIADVTHFVLPDTPLDKEAAQRCTTVYLVERRTDMLPGLLTTDLCSLVPNVDRLTFSVLWEMTPQGSIVGTQFRKAVICSRRAFTYEEAQTLLDDATDRSPLKQSVAQLNRLAQILRSQRMKAGALELASLEVKFQLDSETHSPNDINLYATRDTNKLVEEFMLLANTSVATFILDALPLHSVLRRHPPPKEDQLRQLQTVLRAGGFDNFEFTSSLALAKSLNRITKPNDPFFNKAVRVLTTRCMNQAVYMCAGDITESGPRVPGVDNDTTPIANAPLAKYRHYGLAAHLYTHFTSPIRRYADVLVHRLLAVALQLTPFPDQLADKNMISQQCEQMNIKHRNAQWAGRASVEFYTYRYFKAYGSVEVDAFVIVAKKNGLQVQVPRYGIEGFVLMDPKEYRWCGVSQQLLFGTGDSEESIGVFDHVWLRIYADCSDYRPKTVLQFLRKTPKEILHALNGKEPQGFLKEIDAQRERFEQQLFGGFGVLPPTNSN